MSLLKKSIIAFLSIVSLALFLYGISSLFEEVEITDYSGYKGEAKNNPLFAARLFLKKMGLSTEKIDINQFKNLPDHNTVIIINTKRLTFSKIETEKLLDWVKKGGHLITCTTNNDDKQSKFSHDPLQRALSIITSEEHYVDDKKVPTTIKLNNHNKTFQVEIEIFTAIESKNQTEEKIKIDKKVFLIRRSLGNGFITLASDLDFIENTEIAKQDHAEFFWHLVHGNLDSKTQHPQNIWLLHNDDMPPLWQWLWHQAWALIISLTLLLIAWLYRLSPRFGPMIPKVEPRRRRILEHIQASGYFFWKHKQQSKLIQSTRTALKQRIRQINPAWHQLNQTEQIGFLEQHTKLNHKTLQFLLYEQQQLTAEAFTRLIQQLEKVRKKL